MDKKIPRLTLKTNQITLLNPGSSIVWFFVTSRGEIYILHFQAFLSIKAVDRFLFLKQNFSLKKSLFFQCGSAMVGGGGGQGGKIEICPLLPFMLQLLLALNCD